MEFFKKRAARKAAKEKVEEAVRAAEERTAAKRAVKIDEALEQAIEKQEAENPIEESLTAEDEAAEDTIEALREALEDDPDKRIHITAQTAVASVFSILKDEKGIRIEDALGAIGSFAGYLSICAAMNVSDSSIEPVNGDGAEERLTVLGLPNDETAIYGPGIYEFLMTRQSSIFNLVGMGVQLAGGSTMPDPSLLVQRHTRTLGTESYGIPIVPEGHQLRATPRDFLTQLWPLLESHITVFEKAPDMLCAAMGVAAQDLIVQGKDSIHPDVAAEIAMQSAFATSSIPPATARKEMEAQMKARELAIQKAAEQAETSAGDPSK